MIMEKIENCNVDAVATMGTEEMPASVALGYLERMESWEDAIWQRISEPVKTRKNTKNAVV